MRLYRLTLEAWRTLGWAGVSTGGLLVAGRYAWVEWQAGDTGGAYLLAGVICSLLTLIQIIRSVQAAELAMIEAKWQGESAYLHAMKFSARFSAALLGMVVLVVTAGMWILALSMK